MTLDPIHYVPVLKVKRGEKASLKTLSAHLNSRITPLLEIVERSDNTAPTVEKHLDTAFKSLADSVQAYPRCFLDVREIVSDGPAAAEEVFQRAEEAGIKFVPVTGLSRTVDLPAALEHRAHGIALRLTRDEFENGGLTAAIHRFLAVHALTPEHVDLIIDLGAVNDLIPAGIMSLTDAFLVSVPDHTRWRTFTISACTFPESMGGIASHSHKLVERSEWIAWRDGLHARRNSMTRLPVFSDCVIQHPKGVEGFNPLIMQVSASVRYTLPDEWLLIKGESTRQSPPSVQFPKLAKQLVYGHLRHHFAGPTHCDGCRSIKDAADDAPKLGSAEIWRRLGTIHHITTVMEQLGALSWP